MEKDELIDLEVKTIINMIEQQHKVTEALYNSIEANNELLEKLKIARFEEIKKIYIADKEQEKKGVPIPEEHLSLFEEFQAELLELDIENSEEED